MNLYSFFWKFNTCLIGCLASPCSLAANTEYVIHNRGYTATIQEMLTTTAKRSLELTRDEYGDFNVIEYGAKLSSERIQQLVAKGNNNQLYFSASLTLSNTEKRTVAIDLPFISNILGMRTVIIKQKNAGQFNNINSLDDLRTFSMGVGHSWSEREIFDANNIPYVVSLLTKSLMPMLEKERFDYLALGTIDDIKSLGFYDYANLILLDNLMIFYPIPFRVFINSNNPEVVKRIKLGVSRFIQSGEADAMVKKSLKTHANRIKGQQVRLLVIDNPSYQASSVQQSFEDVQEYFSTQFKIIKQ